MVETLRWGTIGTGIIAGDFARALKHSKRCCLVNVSSLDLATAQRFADEFGVSKASGSPEELLSDPEVDAVYVAVPHTLHERFTLQAIAAKKHVLCEKPMALSAESAERMQAAAKSAGVFLMEGYMYRCHPALHQVVKLVSEGAIGKVRYVRADFSFREERQPSHRLFNPELAGGGILDVGGYPVSFARLIAGLDQGKQYAEPERMSFGGYAGPTGIDELATAELTFAGGLTAQLTCGVYHDVGTSAWVFGDAGKIHLPDAWLPGGERQGTSMRVTLSVYGQDPQHFDVQAPPIYALEAEVVADALPKLEATWPATNWEETLGNMRVLEAWRKACLNPGRA